MLKLSSTASRKFSPSCLLSISTFAEQQIHLTLTRRRNHWHVLVQNHAISSSHTSGPYWSYLNFGLCPTSKWHVTNGSKKEFISFQNAGRTVANSVCNLTAVTSPDESISKWYKVGQRTQPQDPSCLTPVLVRTWQNPKKKLCPCDHRPTFDPLRWEAVDTGHLSGVLGSSTCEGKWTSMLGSRVCIVSI